MKNTHAKKQLRIVYMNRNNEVVSWFQKEISCLIDRLVETGDGRITVNVMLYHTGDVKGVKEFNKMSTSSLQGTTKHGNSAGVMQASMRRIVHRTLSDPSSTPHATVRREVSIEEEDTHKTILETTKEGEQNHISNQFKSHRQLSIEDSRPTHDKKCNVEGKETMSSGSVQFFSGKRPDLENIISNMSPRDSEVFFIGNPALGKTL